MQCKVEKQTDGDS